MTTEKEYYYYDEWGKYIQCASCEYECFEPFVVNKHSRPDKKFIKIAGSFHVKEEFNAYEEKIPHILACPVCGTLKINV